MGPKSQAIIARRKRVMLPSTLNESLYPIALYGGDGVCIMDADGQTYLDFTSQVGTAGVGHSHQRIKKALKDQLREFGGWTLLTCVGSDFDHELQVELAEKLVKITPGDFSKKVWLDVGGAEGIIAAVEFLLHTRPKRRHFWAFRGGFHGRKGYAKDLTCSKAVQKKGYQPSLLVHHFPYIDVDYIEDCIGRDFDPYEVNAVVMEFVQGEGGIEVPDKQAVQDLMLICQKYGILMVADEVQTGLGRTGKMWACQHFGFDPDILVTSKSLGSGLPISATIVRDSVTDDGLIKSEKECLPPGWHSLTFMGSPLPCAVALETLDVIEEEKLIENAESTGNYLGYRLKRIARAKPSYYIAKGLGLMRGLQFKLSDGSPNKEGRDQVIKEALKRGLLLIGAGHPDKNPTIRFMPPLCVSRAQIDQAMDIIDDIIKIG